MYTQQCLKNAVLKKMIFCLRKFSANLAYSIIFSNCHLIRSTALQTKMYRIEGSQHMLF